MKNSKEDYEYQQFVIKNIEKIVKVYYLTDNLEEKNKLINEIEESSNLTNTKIQELINEIKK